MDMLWALAHSPYTYRTPRTATRHAATRHAQTLRPPRCLGGTRGGVSRELALTGVRPNAAHTQLLSRVHARACQLKHRY
eukprot:scaffold21870_cov60-Phaeocystis_antarctica.AAC.3